MMSFAYVRRQLALASSPDARPSIRADALARLSDGLDMLEYQAKEIQACADAMMGGLAEIEEDDDTALEDCPMDPMPTIMFPIGGE